MNFSFSQVKNHFVIQNSKIITTGKREDWEHPTGG